MARQSPLTSEQRRAHRAGTQASMKRRALTRRCSKCSRLNAIVRLKDAAGTVCAVVCRFCKDERRVDHYEQPKPKEGV